MVNSNGGNSWVPRTRTRRNLEAEVREIAAEFAALSRRLNGVLAELDTPSEMPAPPSPKPAPTPPAQTVTTMKGATPLEMACPECGGYKARNFPLCTACVQAKIHENDYDNCPECNAKKERRHPLCRNCSTGRMAETDGRTTCSKCGAPKSPRFPLCQACERAQYDPDNFDQCPRCGATKDAHYQVCYHCHTENRRMSELPY